MASPQTKKVPQPKPATDVSDPNQYGAPPIPEPKPAAKPSTDSGTNKAEFSLPKAAAMFMPSLFTPNPSAGFQFLVPVKPFSLKLPFGQKLEFEVIGRVVPETEVK